MYVLENFTNMLIMRLSSSVLGAFTLAGSGKFLYEVYLIAILSKSSIGADIQTLLRCIYINMLRRMGQQ